VQLTSLSLTNFRSYRSLDLPLGPGLTMVHGDNAQGKSNLLEAVYLLAIGKSYRATTERELVSWEAADAGGYAIVAARVSRGDGPWELRVGFDCAGGAPSGVVKRIRVNGAPKRASELVGVMTAVLFSAEDIDLVFGSPQGRRRYLDILLSQQSRHYVQALQRYQRVLLQRNHLLRAMREGRAGADELTFWDDSLCREGADVLSARYDAMERLAPLVSEAFARLAGGEQALSVSYAATTPWDERPSPELFAQALALTQAQERAAAMTVVGPHRDDLRLELGDVELVRHASRGQGRLAALGLRIAEGQLLHERTGDAPIILLDDVLSELDPRRRELVLGEALRYPQALVTTADPAQIMDGIEARWLRMSDGVVTEEPARPQG
jgi:DNA replication and repair protein RecF